MLLPPDMSDAQRWRAGQGVIQFARATEGGTATPYALKFFAR